MPTRLHVDPQLRVYLSIHTHCSMHSMGVHAGLPFLAIEMTYFSAFHYMYLLWFSSIVYVYTHTEYGIISVVSTIFRYE